MKNTTFYNQNSAKKQVLSFILFIFAFALPPQIQAQTDPVVAWAERFGGTFFGASGGKIISDASGNVYMTGQFTGTADFGDITLTSTSVGSPDAFVVKTNASGTVLWAEQFGGGLQDYGVNLTVDASGNVYTSGFFNGTADFGTFTLTTDTGYRNIFVVKQNASGQVLWAEKFKCVWTNGPYSFRPTGITTDTWSNLYTIGLFTGDTATFGDINLTRPAPAINNSTFDTFVVKQNASGQVLWAKNFGASESFVGGVDAMGIVSDVSGNIYITGTFRGTVDFGGTTFTSTTTTGNVFIIKVSSSGEVLWAKQFGEEGDSFSSTGLDIVTDMTGNVYITGGFAGEMTVGTDTITSVYSSQYYSTSPFILKTDSSGEGLWVKGFESQGRGQSIIIDSSDNVYVTGYFTGTVDFDGITLTSSPTANTSNMFVLKTDSSGTVEWAEHFFGSEVNYGNGVALGLAENIYVSGYFSGTVDFEDTTLEAIGYLNIFLVKIAMDGNLIVEQNQPGQYRVYPNPVKDIIHIEIESGTEADVEVFNLLGQKVMNCGTITNNELLDLSNLTTGVYLLKINNSIIKIKKQ